MRKKNIFRGLTGVMAVLLSIAVTGTELAVFRASFINSRLGTSSYATVDTGEGEEDTIYFKSEFSSLEEVVRAQEELAVQISSEGSVLFKNNGALPINASSETVTLWGLNSLFPTRGGTIGSSAVAAEGQANYDLVGALKADGVSLNETMLAHYGSQEAFSYVRTNLWGMPGASFTPQFTATHETMPMYTIGEMPKSAYTEDVISSADGTTAICTISRDSCEAAEYEKMMFDTAGDTFERPLALSQNERDMLEMAKAHSTKVIVLINSDSPMEIGELKNDSEIDAILWVGEPGIYGFKGAADVLTGAANPSGHIADTYAANNESAAALVNWGLYEFTNNSNSGSGDVLLTEENKGDWYVVENEGIYVGYKYYETRYEDCVLGRGNADAAEGSTGGGAWNYENEVVYPFGYGLSYTTFEEKLDDVSVKTGEAGTATVTVTNTGSTAGKHAVQLYVQAPYLEGGVEKSAIQLAGYAKTSLLEPGASETLTIEVDPAFFASYDETAVKADGTQGAWILDAGDYYFAIGNGAHDALNNVLAAKLDTEEGLVKINDDEIVSADKVKVWNLAETDIETYSMNVENRLQDSDINKLIPGTAEYFTRSDWKKGWKEVTEITPTENMMAGLTNSSHTLEANGSGVDWGIDSGLQLINMLVKNEDGSISAVDYEDPLWDQLVDQITFEEAIQYIQDGGDDLEPLVSLGVSKIYMNDGPIGFSYDQVGGYKTRWTKTDSSQPTYVDGSGEYDSYSMATMPTEPVVAATFNHDLVRREGEILGEMGLWAKEGSIIGPGVNLHRNPYNGRNHEYYSEDSQLTNLMAVDLCTGASSKGLMTAAKHFAFNHQELNRSGLATFVTEQGARENELRCFQGIMTQNITSSMTTFNRLGTVYGGGHDGMIDGIAHTEWGYVGGFITDMINGARYMNWLDTVSAGGGVMLGNSGEWSPLKLGDMKANESAIKADTAFQLQMKRCIKDWLYKSVQSNAMNGISSSAKVVKIAPWWQKTLYGVCGGLGAITALCLILYLRSLKKKQ